MISLILWIGGIKQYQKYQTKHIITVWSSNHVPWYLLKLFEKLYLQKKTCTQIVITAWLIIDNTWKQPSCSSIDEQINSGTSTGENVIQEWKKKSYETMKTHGTIFKCILLSISQSEKVRQNYGNSKVISGCQGFSGVRREGWIDGTRDVLSTESILYGTVMVEICHYTFVRTPKLYNTKR